MIIRPYSKGDEEGILALRRLVFGDMDPHKLSLQAWEWEYLENPLGRPIIVVAEERNEIIGHYGLLPSKILFYGKEFTAGLAVDLMVHPAHRRKGLFLRLFEKVCLEAQDSSRIMAIFGFPNNITLPVYVQRLGWNYLKTIRTFFLPRLGSVIIPFLRECHSDLSSSPGAFPDVEDNRHNIVITKARDFNFFGENTKTKYNLFVYNERSIDYLTWRYLRPSWYGYHVFAIYHRSYSKGYLVLRFLSYGKLKIAVLMDIFPIPLLNGKMYKIVIRLLKKICFNQEADILVYPDSLSLISPISRVGIKLTNFFNPRPWYLGWKDITSNPIPSPVHVYMTFGDGDVI